MSDSISSSLALNPHSDVDDASYTGAHGADMNGAIETRFPIDRDVDNYVIPTVTDIVIDSHSDLRLLVGAESGDRISRFFVSRNVMQLASPVWSIMLSSLKGWSESNGREIEFPDDDPEALHFLLRIAHLDFSMVKSIQSDRLLFHIAVLCDKYELNGLVKAFGKAGAWMEGAQ